MPSRVWCAARPSESGLGNPELLATIARVAVWGFGIVIAVNQIGVATTIVNTLFMAMVGSIAIAFALAFGLGGRDTAAEIVRNWYEQGRSNAPKLAQAAEASARQDRAPNSAQTAHRRRR